MRPPVHGRIGLRWRRSEIVRVEPTDRSHYMAASFESISCVLLFLTETTPYRYQIWVGGSPVLEGRTGFSLIDRVKVRTAHPLSNSVDFCTSASFDSRVFEFSFGSIRRWIPGKIRWSHSSRPSRQSVAVPLNFSETTAIVWERALF